jgi:two-component system OmpR family response regulator
MKQRLPTVLLVEDDESTAEVMAELLESNQFRVHRAASAADAARFSAEHRVDLVVLDLILPDSDGLVFLIELRRHTDAPVIVCSATNRHRDAVLALRLGADDFIAKPFDIAEFEERVRVVMRRAAPARATAVWAA